MMGSKEPSVFRGGGRIHSQSITRDGLFQAWRDFQKGKTNKKDVLAFSLRAEESLHILWNKIHSGKYTHGVYETFLIRDPKLRTISKASVEDRIVHRALHSTLEPLFEKGFIFDSFSSRKGKGVHAALFRFESFARALSQSNKKAVWVLKCDIKKFFDSVDHSVLFKRIEEKVDDDNTLSILRNIIESFCTKANKGIPLGNLTSQLFSNIYLDIFDQWVKRKLQVKHYLRYADDFIILSSTQEELEIHLKHIVIFLRDRLQLSLHPNKVFIGSWRQGVDVLGYISFPNHRIVRTKTKQRIRKRMTVLHQLLSEERISQPVFEQTIASYNGRIKHCWSKNLEAVLRLNLKTAIQSKQ